jgi:hypothetical protein
MLNFTGDEKMEILIKIYVYLTDFTITMANLLGITYEDFNALLFCIIWPVFTFLLLVLFVWQWWKLRRSGT